MLLQEFNDMMLDLNALSISIDNIFEQLDRLMSSNNKNYTIQFKNKIFDFYPATTKMQARVMKRNRHKLIRLLLSYTIKKYLKSMPVKNISIEQLFDCLLCFTYGADPKDHQFEKIDMQQMYNVVDQDGKKITGLPLDMESEYVKNDLRGEHVNPHQKNDSNLDS